jgi:hypothetical protein
MILRISLFNMLASSMRNVHFGCKPKKPQKSSSVCRVKGPYPLDGEHIFKNGAIAWAKRAS